jgi:hypothetical protein
MNRVDFISFVKQPENIQQGSIDLLKQFSKDYPYCQTAQVVLAKALHNSGNIAYENQLRLAAAYATDRKVLHRLILEKNSAPPIPEEVEPVEQVVAPITEAEPPFIPPIPKPEPIIEPTIEPVDFVPQEPIYEPIVPISTSPLEEEVPAEPTIAFETIPPAPIEEVDSTATPVKEEKTEEDLFLERHILSSAISSTFLLEADEIEEDEELDEETLENTPATTVESTSEEHSFNEWLGLFNDPTKIEAKTEKVEPKKADLISQFIKTEPQIRPKREFYSPANMARLSVKEDDDLVTETLAKIYAQQGNKERAISAYEKLALKYPEKRIYFANQINKLGEEPK